MAKPEQLVKELVKLEDPDWLWVLEQANTRRRERAAPLEEPRPGMTRDELAEWAAQLHLSTDPAIREIVYLPHKASEKEVRLLAINVLLQGPESDQIEYVDIGPPAKGLEQRVLIADLTPQQWEEVQSGTLALPKNWDLRRSRTFSRAKPA